MSALAQHLLHCGTEVSGSDRHENSQTQKLRSLGARIYTPHCAGKMGDPGLVVRTSAVSLCNEEVSSAKKRGIPVKLREELLGEIFNGFPKRIAVCGTHGKTTVTAMLHYILKWCGFSHTAFVGGEYLGENYCFGKDIVIAEACEYNRSFLHLRPDVCLCLNVEFDHPDCYKNSADVENAFKQLFAQSGQVILPADRKDLWKNAVFFGGDGLVAEQISFEGGCPRFVVRDGDKKFACRLKICGEHNISNALAALTAAKTLNLPLEKATDALATFCGVDRRWTEIPCRFRVVCDYAHHPTEIAASLKTARRVCGGKVFCVFQPHTYSRTKALLGLFAECFDNADYTVLLPVFAARETPDSGATSLQLFETMRSRKKSVGYFATFAETAAFLKKEVAANDIVLLVGAGDVNKLADLLK